MDRSLELTQRFFEKPHKDLLFADHIRTLKGEGWTLHRAWKGTRKFHRRRSLCFLFSDTERRQALQKCAIYVRSVSRLTPHSGLFLDLQQLATDPESFDLTTPPSPHDPHTPARRIELNFSHWLQTFYDQLKWVERKNALPYEDTVAEMNAEEQMRHLLLEVKPEVVDADLERALTVDRSHQKKK